MPNSDYCDRIHGRRITSGTKGSIFSIRSAKLHILPSACVDNDGIINFNFEVPANLYKDSCAHPFRQRACALIPVMFIQDMYYIGGDGTDTLGQPVALRNERSIIASSNRLYSTW